MISLLRHSNFMSDPLKLTKDEAKTFSEKCDYDFINLDNQYSVIKSEMSHIKTDQGLYDFLIDKNNYDMITSFLTSLQKLTPESYMCTVPNTEMVCDQIDKNIPSEEEIDKLTTLINMYGDDISSTLKWFNNYLKTLVSTCNNGKKMENYNKILKLKHKIAMMLLDTDILSQGSMTQGSMPQGSMPTTMYVSYNTSVENEQSNEEIAEYIPSEDITTSIVSSITKTDKTLLIIIIFFIVLFVICMCCSVLMCYWKKSHTESSTITTSMS